MGNLWAAVLDWSNLELAAVRALKGKRNRSDARRFLDHSESELTRLRFDLESGQIGPGTFRQFRIRDPKPRIISAPSFRDRVLHHAIMNVMEPHLERRAIHHSYACRVGKGQFAALDAAVRFSRTFEWYAQMDVRSFFASIPKDRLLVAVARCFKDSRLLDALGQIVHGFEPASERGLPLGALTSQHLANFYLGAVDRHVTLALGRAAFVRYMDDWLVWDSDRTRLRAVVRSINQFCIRELALDLKIPRLNRTSAGISFLGHRVFPAEIRLARPARLGFLRSARNLEQRWAAGTICEPEAQRRMASLVGFTRHSASLQWRRRVFRDR
ncbi:MAG: group II intron reverse transcriptase domain-containing protein [Verrucomicrobiales bacterium]|nr:group II intron reverse transcriptase domain-containing protein [Verrucomicrobiales bacterium]